jgi:hypothetical protein
MSKSTEPKTCEAIEAVFSWGATRCGRPATGEAIDATWGTIHPVCAEHDPGVSETARIVEVLIAEGGMTRETAEQIAPGLARAGVTVSEVSR